MSWLGDQVFSIREAATANLTKLAEVSQRACCVYCVTWLACSISTHSRASVQVFGATWAKAHILPKVVSLGALAARLLAPAAAVLITRALQGLTRAICSA